MYLFVDLVAGGLERLISSEAPFCCVEQRERSPFAGMTVNGLVLLIIT